MFVSAIHEVAGRCSQTETRILAMPTCNTARSMESWGTRISNVFKRCTFSEVLVRFWGSIDFRRGLGNFNRGVAIGWFESEKTSDL